MSEQTCHDCGAKEGEIHQMGCDMEKCPFCGGQLISCGCEYRLLGYDYKGFASHHPTNGLPKDVYENGLSEEEWDVYHWILFRRERIPYIVYPNMCAKCGELWPNMFMAPDDEWEYYIEPAQRDKMLCKKCYTGIKHLIDTRKRAAERGE